MAGKAIVGQRSARVWYWLLLVPFGALLLPVYLRHGPELAGFPFFYWYQFAVLLISAALTAAVAYVVRDSEP